MPKLKFTLPDAPERIHDLADDEVTVGRVADNDLQIEDDSVSSHHAVFRLKGESYLLEDLQSTNGTMVNGNSVNETLLIHGDNIRFGKVDMVFLTEDASEMKPMPESTDQAGGASATTTRPSNFVNSSPFPKVHSTKDPARLAGYFLSAVGILGFAFVVFTILMTMETPSFPAP